MNVTDLLRRDLFSVLFAEDKLVCRQRASAWLWAFCELLRGAAGNDLKGLHDASDGRLDRLTH